MRHLSSIASLGLATLATLAVAGCAADTEPQAPEPTFEVAQSSVARVTNPDATAAEMAALAEGNAAFTMKVYGLTAAASSGNAFFSPLSISTALGMAYAGARGDTATEMARALEHRLPADRHHVAMNALDLQIASRANGQAAAPSGKPFALRSVNTTFGQKGLPFESPFLDTLASSYGAGVQLADFKTKANDERLKINAWVSHKTEGKIEDLLAEGTISGLTRLVLVNAVYFNADWAHPFTAEGTRPQPFQKLDGSSPAVPMMSMSTMATYGETATAKVLELPYMGGQVSMVVVLPKGDFKAFEASFDGKGLLAATAGLEQHQVIVTLPKFEIKGESFSLRKSLQALGMSKAFDGATADFSGMVAPSVEKLWVSDVVHKAFVRVDEKGTEAAAATAVAMAGAPSVPEELKTFKADKPFLFFIRDIPTNTTLFAGRIVSPE